MNILVTGGAGYIGSHTVSELIKTGHNVFVYDNLSYGHEDKVDRKARFIKGDITDKESLANSLKTHKIDSVVHFAAFTYVGESVKDPSKYYSNNLAGGINLLNCMKESNVKKIVFSSSCAIFGQPKKVPITEDEKKEPLSPYGKSKLFFESMLEDYDKAYGIKSVCLRYFNAAGASLDSSNGEMHDPETHLVPLAIKAALDSDFSLTVFGDDYPTNDGTCIRDYIHILDLADAHIKALDYLSKKNQSNQFNLGSEKGHSIMEIIKKIEELGNVKVKFKIGERREGDPAMLIADSTKIKKTLGWNPKHSDLETIIKTALAWHVKEYSK